MTTKQVILLTGATGFLGSLLLEMLIVKGYQVCILKRSTSDTWRINHLLESVKCYDVDVQPIDMAFKKQHIDVVIHAACHYGRNSDSIAQIADSNLMFGLKVLDACLEYGVYSIINTDTLLQKDLNTYTLSKKQYVEWLHHVSEKIQVINFKLEHMYGPKDDVNKFVPWVLSQLKDNVTEIDLTKGEQLRDFIYIDDVVAAYTSVLENLPNLPQYSEFDVGTGKLVSVKEFLVSLKRVYETNCGTTKSKYCFGAIPYRKGEMMSVDLDNNSLMALGWAPSVKLEDGLNKVVKELK